MRKTPLSSTTVTVDQFCVAKRRLFAEIRPTRRMDTTRPATTAATRPDPPRCSAGMEARKGMAKEKTVSEVGSFRRARTRTPSSPTAQPTPIATTSAIRKAEARAPGLSAFSLAATPALVAAARRTRAVASLNSPSPSSTVMIRWATPLRLAMETATASVGEMTAPRAMAQGNEICGTIQLTRKPMAAALMTTRGMASMATADSSRRKSMVGIRTAAENSSGGRTISRTMWGSILTGATTGRKPIARPTPSRISGDATPTRGAANWQATMMSIPMRTMSSGSTPPV